MTRGVSAARRHDYRGGQLLALLLVAVVVPSACVLWFMNEAATNEAEASRRAIVEAYRGQLRLVRGRLNASWQNRAADLEAAVTGNAAADFKRLVAGGAADSVLVLADDGTPLYPSLAARPDETMSADEAAAAAGARAAQKRIRGLVKAGDTRTALALIDRYFTSGRWARGADPEGRLIAADEQLHAITLMGPADPRRAMWINRLAALLTDYSTARVPSAQRLFLMGQLQAMGATGAEVSFSTLDAERVAIAFLEIERPAPGAAALRPTGRPGVWQLSSPRGRIVALYRTDTVERAMRALLDDRTSGTGVFVVNRPGATTNDEAMAIGPSMPGWEISFTASHPAAGAALGRRRSYLSIALLAIVAVAVAVATIAGAARKQARLASLKTDLVSAVSHELKTPLASMRLLVDALLEDENVDPVKTRDYLVLMSTENARLSRLIDNFLTFSRLERNRHQFTFKATSPLEVVHLALASMPERTRGDRAPTVEVTPDLPAIVADQDALVTALLNLLDNAYKYTPADERIVVRAFREGDHVVLSVADNGIGIPPREHRRIFRRFYRVDQRLARDTAGSGLGLSIVEAIVRAHGGWVSVRSRPAHGSTFAIHLPCVPGVEPA
jgi:signal transduction histidine kinase